VKEYDEVPVLAVLITAGFHVPAMPLLEVVGSAGAKAFWHRGPIRVNVGAMLAITSMSMVMVAAH
jgi:hypothetical protein